MYWSFTRKILYLRIIIIAIAIQGCAAQNTIHSAFDDLTFDGSRNSTAFASYHSTLSLSGLITPHAPGMFFFEPDSNSLDLLPPSLLSGISPSCSFTVESTYSLPRDENGANLVKDIRLNYITLRDKAIELASLRAKLGVIQEALHNLGEKAADDKKMKLAMSVLKIDEKKTPEENKTDLENLSASLKVEYDTKQTQLKESVEKFTKLASTPNLIVMRWVRKNNTSGSGNLGVYLSIGGGKEEQANGILIIADIRTRSLVFGDDFRRFVRQLVDDDGIEYASLQLQNLGIATFAIEAKHIAYLSEMDYLTAASLSIGITKENLSSLLDENTKLEIASIVSNAANLSNMGIISNPTTQVMDYAFMSRPNHLGFIKKKLNLPNDGYSTVFAVRASVNPAVINLLGKLPRKEDTLHCAENLSNDWLKN